MKVNGVDLHIQISGDDTGVPFIWGHGLTSSMAVEDMSPWIRWERLTDVIQRVRYDARGHGKSGMSDDTGDYHWSALAQDMLAVADQLHFERFVAGGQSMGCATSIYAALAAPERIEGLVLMNPPTAWETRAAQSGIYAQMADVIENRGIEELITLQQQMSMTVPVTWQANVFPEATAHYEHYMRGLNPKALVKALRGAQLTDLPPKAQLESIHAPALILAWTDDPGHPVSSAEELARRLPNARLLIASSAAETLAWTDEIRAFITSLT